MRCRFFLPLVVLVGCGGRFHEPAAVPVTGPTLGSAALDLTITPTAGAGAPLGTTMVGMGSTPGSLILADPSPSLSEYGYLDVSASLSPTKAPNGANLIQGLSLHLVHPSGLAVGTVFTLAPAATDGSTSTATFEEIRTFAASGDGIGYEWKATGGTVTVTARSGLNVTLTLTNVVLPESPDESGLQRITISGTISGTLVPPTI